MTSSRGPWAGRRTGDSSAFPAARAIRRGAWVIVASVLLTVGAALLFSLHMGRTYTAEAQLVVTPVASDDATFTGLPVIRQSSDATRDVSTLTAYAETQDVRDEAGRTLTAAGFTPRQVDAADRELEINPVASSYLVSVVAAADEPGRAAAIANAYADATVTVRQARFNEQLQPKLGRAQDALRQLPSAGAEGAAAVPVREELVRQVSQLQGLLGAPDPSFQVLSAAVDPVAFSGPGLPVILIAASVAGLILGLALAALLDAARTRRLENDADLAHNFEAPILCYVPLLRGGAGPGAIAPHLIRPSAWQAYGKLSEKIETLRHDRASSHVIAFIGAGGGNGTTTSALNTAVQLVEAGHSVLLVDSDMRGHALSDVLAVAPAHGVRAVLERRVSLRSAAVRWREEYHLDLLLVNVVEGSSPAAGAVDNVRRLIAQAKGHWDFVIVDVARPARGGTVNPFVSTADDVLVTVRFDHTPMDGLEDLMELFAEEEIEARGFIVIGGRRDREIPRSAPPAPVIPAQAGAPVHENV